MSENESATQPGLDCVVGMHLWFEAVDAGGSVAGSWCPWCGTGVTDPDRITDNGEPIGFDPTFVVRVPDGFHRR